MKPFVADLGSHGVVLTGAKHRLTAMVVNATTRKPSHLVNRFWVRPLVRTGLRLAGVPAEKAKNLSQRYADYLGRAVDAQCDALVIAPFGKKIERAAQAAFREDVLAGLPELVGDLSEAIETARA